MSLSWSVEYVSNFQLSKDMIYFLIEEAAYSLTTDICIKSNKIGTDGSNVRHFNPITTMSTAGRPSTWKLTDGHIQLELMSLYNWNKLINPNNRCDISFRTVVWPVWPCLGRPSSPSSLHQVYKNRGT